MSATLDRVTTYKDIGVLLMKYLPKISDARKNLTAHFDLPDDIEPSEDAEKFTDDLEDLGPTVVPATFSINHMTTAAVALSTIEFLSNRWIASYFHTHFTI